MSQGVPAAFAAMHTKGLASGTGTGTLSLFWGLESGLACVLQRVSRVRGGVEDRITNCRQTRAVVWTMA